MGSSRPAAVSVHRSGGKKQRIWRCTTCQTAVFSQYTSARIRFVRAGTLDEPASIAPDVHIYTRSKLPWVELPEDVPGFAVYYDSKKLWPAASLERLEGARAPAHGRRERVRLGLSAASFLDGKLKSRTGAASDVSDGRPSA